MKLAVLGINHKGAPVEIREKLAFPEDSLADALIALQQHCSLDEAVVLSTCNRVELYLIRYDDHVHWRDVQEFLTSYHGLEPDKFAPYLYKLRETEAIEHLFRVAAGVDSMVIGETQILAQLKDAYRLSAHHSLTGRFFDPLFQTALSVAKEVHTQTGIGQRKVSVSSVAVDLAEKIFTTLEGRSVLVIGAGKMSRLTLNHMLDKGAQKILVTNRSFERAEALAIDVGGQALPFNEMEENLSQADIVISSTASSGIVLRPQHLREALRRRRYQPIFLIDIAVPRDIDPAVNEIDSVYLYDIDDLDSVVAENLTEREGELEECKRLISERVNEFVSERRIADIGPIIAQLTRQADEIRQTEIERALNKLGDISDKDREEIEYLTKRIVNKILNSPISAIREEVVEGNGFRILDATQKLFNLGEENEEPQEDAVDEDGEMDA